MTKRRLMLAGLLALVLIGAGWPVYAAHVARDVSLEWTRDPVCRGASVEHGVVQLRPGTRCTVTLMVINHDSRAVHLRSLGVFGLGSGFGAPLGPVSRGTDDDARLDLAGDQWASFPLDRDVPGSTVSKVSFSFEYVERGCGETDGIAGSLIQLRYSTLGLPHRAEADHLLHWTPVDPVTADCPVD